MSHPTNHHASEDRRPGTGQPAPDLGDFLARVRARMDLVRQAAAVTASRASARRNADKLARIERELRLDPRCSNRRLAERAAVSLGIATRHRQRLQMVARR